MAFGSDRSVKLGVAVSMDGFVREMDRGGSAARKFQKDVTASTKSVAQGLHEQEAAAKTVATPLIAIGAAAALGVGYAVKSFADFDERMSSVQSLSHATRGEMEQLQTAALNSGTAIGYSATQAADAEIELVKAGVSANDIIGGALVGSLKLAAAGQIDVADATSIAASTLTQFNLTGKDVTHIADLLAAGADKALGGVDELGQGLKYLGPVAAANNISLEQTVGTMALLAQNAILGEQAGTSLRGVLSSLTSPSKVAAETMKQYGINVYDAQGRFVGFNGVAEQLNKRLYNLGDAERNAALGRIFGNEQITAATILMKSGRGEVDKWTNAVNEQGFATEQAVGKMDNLNGDLTKLRASFQTAAIETGAAADGPLRGAVQTTTDLVQAYGAAPATMQAFVLGTGAVTAGVALTTGAMLLGIPKIVEFGKALQVLAAAQIPGVSRAAGLALTSVNKFSGGIVRTLGYLGAPFGLALGGALLAVDLFDKAASSGAASQEELANAIEHTVSSAKLLELAGQRSDLSKFLVGDTEERLKNIPALLDRQTDGWAQFLSMVTLGGGAADAANQQAFKSLKQLGDQLATVAAADAPAASKAFSQLVEQQNLTDKQAKQLLTGSFSQYGAELRNQARDLGISTSQQNLLLLATGRYTEAAANAKNPTKENADALQALNEQADSAGQSIDELSKSIKEFGSSQLDANGAERAFQQAIDDATDAVQKNAGAVTDGATAFDLTSEKGRNASSALDQIGSSARDSAAAMLNNGASTEQAAAKIQAGRDQVVQMGEKLGLTREAAERYADSLGLIPANVTTLVDAQTAAASTNVSNLREQIGAIPTLKQIQVAAETGQAQTNLDNLIRQNDGRVIHIAVDAGPVARSTVGGLTKAAGGPVYGPGTGTSDSIPAWLSNGEHVITAREVAAAGGHAAIYAYRKALVAGQRPAFAAGGPVVARYAPSTPTIVVQTGGATGGQPLVGSVDMRIEAGDPNAAISQLMFALRTLDNGGRP